MRLLFQYRYIEACVFYIFHIAAFLQLLTPHSVPSYFSQLIKDCSLDIMTLSKLTTISVFVLALSHTTFGSIIPTIPSEVLTRRELGVHEQVARETSPIDGTVGMNFAVQDIKSRGLVSRSWQNKRNPKLSSKPPHRLPHGSLDFAEDVVGAIPGYAQLLQGSQQPPQINHKRDAKVSLPKKLPHGSLGFAGNVIGAVPGYAQIFQGNQNPPTSNHKRHAKVNLPNRLPHGSLGFAGDVIGAVPGYAQLIQANKNNRSLRSPPPKRHAKVKLPKKLPHGTLGFAGDVIGAVPGYAQMIQGNQGNANPPANH